MSNLRLIQCSCFFRITSTKKPYAMLCLFELTLIFVEFLCLLSLLFELLKLLIQFRLNIFNPREVLSRILQPEFSFPASFSIFRHTCRLFKKGPHVIWPSFNDPRNHPLFDDCITLATKTRTKENVSHVASSDMLIIQVIRRRTLPFKYSLNGNFRVLSPRSS